MVFSLLQKKKIIFCSFGEEGVSVTSGLLVLIISGWHVLFLLRLPVSLKSVAPSWYSVKDMLQKCTWHPQTVNNPWTPRNPMFSSLVRKHHLLKFQGLCNTSLPNAKLPLGLWQQSPKGDSFSKSSIEKMKAWVWICSEVVRNSGEKWSMKFLLFPFLGASTEQYFSAPKCRERSALLLLWLLK